MNPWDQEAGKMATGTCTNTLPFANSDCGSAQAGWMGALLSGLGSSWEHVAHYLTLQSLRVLIHRARLTMAHKDSCKVTCHAVTHRATVSVHSTRQSLGLPPGSSP